MSSFDQAYPMFVLAFCIFKKSDYTKYIVPKIQSLKFRWFGHDAVVLHERELRKGNPPFDKLGGKAGHNRFLEEVSSIVAEAPMNVIATAIDKEKLSKKFSNPHNPYMSAINFCMESTIKFLMKNDMLDKKLHLIFEARGKQEDKDVELEFRRICDTRPTLRTNNCFDIKFVSKNANSSGLQLADLIARPIGRHVLNPSQENRAFDIIKSKILDFSTYQKKYDPSRFLDGIRVFP